MLWSLALACATLLLLAPIPPRTTWVPSGRNPDGLSRTTEGTSWQLLTLLAGIVAIGSLFFAQRSRPYRSVSVLGAAVAAIVLSVASAGLVKYTADVMYRYGSVRFEGWLLYAASLGDGARSPRPEGMVLYPAPFAPYAAVIAAAGASFALALAVRWQQPATENDNALLEHPAAIQMTIHITFALATAACYSVAITSS